MLPDPDAPRTIEQPQGPPYASRASVDLLNATIYGTYGQGGLLREIEGLRRQLRRNTQAITGGALMMAGSLIALAAAIANLH